MSWNCKVIQYRGIHWYCNAVYHGTVPRYTMGLYRGILRYTVYYTVYRFKIPRCTMVLYHGILWYSSMVYYGTITMVYHFHKGAARLHSRITRGDGVGERDLLQPAMLKTNLHVQGSFQTGTIKTYCTVMDIDRYMSIVFVLRLIAATCELIKVTVSLCSHTVARLESQTRGTGWSRLSYPASTWYNYIINKSRSRKDVGLLKQEIQLWWRKYHLTIQFQNWYKLKMRGCILI
jgi:hypothetical protein